MQQFREILDGLPVLVEEGTVQQLVATFTHHGDGSVVYDDFLEVVESSHALRIPPPLLPLGIS